MGDAEDNEVLGEGTSPSDQTAVLRKSTRNKKQELVPADATLRDELAMGSAVVQGVQHTVDTIGLETEKPQAIRKGTNIGRYVVLGRLGAGGMGTVYGAYDPELDRKVALKFLFANASHDEAARAEVMREGQSMARLSHENVCAVYDVGDHNDRIFFALEHIEGKTLRKWLKAAKPSWKQILRTLSGAGRGLAAAHEAGIIHRDVKPSNVLVEDSGKALVTDFGIAALSADVGETIQSTNALPAMDEALIGNEWPTPESQESDTTAGTPPYMSPEQHQGLKLDARSDQFGFCATLYVALYGSLPFPGKAIEVVRENILEGVPSPPPTATKVPRWVEKIVFRGLQRDPDDRFDSMDQLLRELSLDRRSHRRNLRFAAIAAVSALALVGWLANKHAVAEARLGFECKGAEQKLAQTWNAGRAQTVKAHFISTGVSHAEDTWQRVETSLNEYSKNWASMHLDSCTATRVRKELSESMLDLRMTCLERRKNRMEQLLVAFESADKKIVNRAVRAVQSLPPIATCGDLEALSKAIRPPEQPGVRLQVEAVRQQLGAIDTQSILGRLAQALESAKATALHADTINYLPVQAEAQFTLAFHYFRTGNLDNAESSLERASWLAQAAGHDKFVAKCANLGIFISANLKGDHDEARKRARAAEAALIRYGAQDTVLGRYHMSLGTLAHRTGDRQGALKHYTKSAEVYSKVHGAESVLVGKALNNVALAHHMLGNYEEALRQHLMGLKIKSKELGPTHPDIGHSLINIGEVYRLQGNYDEAAERFEQAYELWAESIGATHPNVGFPLNNLAEVYLVQGKYDEAVDGFEKALAIWAGALGGDNMVCAYAYTGIGEAKLLKGEVKQALVSLKRALDIREASQGDPGERGRIRYSYAKALYAQGNPASVAYAQKAIKDFQAAGDAKTTALAEADAWLAEIDTQETRPTTR